MGWHRNEGAGNFGPKILVSTSELGVRNVHTADLDGDNKIDLINVINELTDYGNKRVHTEAVMLEAAANGILEREANTLLEDLEKDHLIRRTQGYIEST